MLEEGARACRLKPEIDLGRLLRGALVVALALSPAPDDRPVEPPVKVPFRGFGKNRKVKPPLERPRVLTNVLALRVEPSLNLRRPVAGRVFGLNAEALPVLEPVPAEPVQPSPLDLQEDAGLGLTHAAGIERFEDVLDKGGRQTAVEVGLGHERPPSFFGKSSPLLRRLLLKVPTVYFLKSPNSAGDHPSRFSKVIQAGSLTKPIASLIRSIGRLRASFPVRISRYPCV